MVDAAKLRVQEHRAHINLLGKVNRVPAARLRPFRQHAMPLMVCTRTAIAGRPARESQRRQSCRYPIRTSAIDVNGENLGQPPQAIFECGGVALATVITSVPAPPPQY
jgi:hypothetical protein